MTLTIRLHDTLSGGLRPLPLIEPITIYVCGVTPYDTTHLGHAFTFIAFDVLIRYLESEGLKVVYTQNVTDVDDPLYAKARETGSTAEAVTQVNMDRYLDDLHRLGFRMPDHMPYASAEVPGMIEIISRLLDSGHAYRSGARVYFDISRFPAYGNLSRRTPVSMRRKLTAEGSLPDPMRRSALDFLLWQPSAADEPSWDAPFGRGRPGWHIECSAMSRRTLGQPLTLHGGGRDLVFSHHESEIAQSEASDPPHQLARHWMHTAMVRYQGHKMSKSLGNLVLVSETLRDHSPQALRWLLLERSYRRDWTFTWELLVRADARARALAIALGGDVGHERSSQLDSLVREALGNDLDTRTALSLLSAWARRSRGRGDSESGAIRASLRHWGGILGVLPPA